MPRTRYEQKDCRFGRFGVGKIGVFPAASIATRTPASTTGASFSTAGAAAGAAADTAAMAIGCCKCANHGWLAPPFGRAVPSWAGAGAGAGATSVQHQHVQTEGIPFYTAAADESGWFSVLFRRSTCTGHDGNDGKSARYASRCFFSLLRSLYVCRWQCVIHHGFSGNEHREFQLLHSRFWDSCRCQTGRCVLHRQDKFADLWHDTSAAPSRFQRQSVHSDGWPE